MSEREIMLRRLSGAQFAAFEMHIYLDTHPYDSEALKSFKIYDAQAAKLKAEFESKYGPLTAGDVFGDNRWDWVNPPWPWENESEMKV